MRSEGGEADMAVLMGAFREIAKKNAWKWGFGSLHSIKTETEDLGSVAGNDTD